MKIEFDALSQKIIIEPYKSWQEKELMLVSSYADIEDDSALDIGLDILKIPQSTIKSLTIQEKKALMYKFREVSVGETIEVKFVCKHCKIPNQATISIKNIIKKPIKKSESIIDLHRLPIDENDLRTNFFKNANEMDYEQYEQIAYSIKDYLTYYDFNVKTNCINCKKQININLYNNKFIFDSMSYESIESLYKTYHSLIYFGHWNKLDIDNLYPFERLFFIGLLNKSIEEQNKKKMMQK